MTILFHNTTFDKIDVWKKTIKKYFKNEKIISIKDYKNFNNVNCALQQIVRETRLLIK